LPTKYGENGRLSSSNQTAVPVEVVSQHVAGSFYATLAWRLTHDMPYPPEAMAEMVFQLCQVGVKGFMQTADYLDERGKRGSREILLEILSKAPDIEPEEYDRL
jgi:hypothetical protein